MNYFAHYYFDHRPGEIHHNLGLLTPDFVRNFLPGKRLQPERFTGHPHPETEALHRGTMKHVALDKRFHQSAFFKDITPKIGTLIKPIFQEYGIPRAWFAAHLIAELMIDRILIKQEPDLIARFYAELEQTQAEIIDAYLLSLDIDTTEEFKKRLQRFCELRYLMQYVHNPAFAFSLSRIYMYARVSPEWTEQQNLGVQSVLDETESLIFVNMPRLMEEMK
ncbi:MAG: hypothetical protein ACK5FT_03230 [Sphingomonadales bacterium]